MYPCMQYTCSCVATTVTEDSHSMFCTTNARIAHHANISCPSLTHPQGLVLYSTLPKLWEGDAYIPHSLNCVAPLIIAHTINQAHNLHHSNVSSTQILCVHMWGGGGCSGSEQCSCPWQIALQCSRRQRCMHLTPCKLWLVLLLEQFKCRASQVHLLVLAVCANTSSERHAYVALVSGMLKCCCWDQFFRLERQQAGSLYRPSLFHPAGSIHVSSNTSPAPQQLELLLGYAGAKVCWECLVFSCLTFCLCYINPEICMCDQSNLNRM